MSRIARYGALPRVLLEIILANATWLQVPEVRRALLANPRLGTDQALKVLRLTPRHELRLAAVQTAGMLMPTRVSAPSAAKAESEPPGAMMAGTMVICALNMTPSLALPSIGRAIRHILG